MPTACDTPAILAASSLECPSEIDFQNGPRSARCKTGGLPGDRSFARSNRSDFNFFGLKNTSDQEVLRRRVEFTQYFNIQYSERLAEAGVEPSAGSKGDSYDNALAGTITGLYKAEMIHRRAPWRPRRLSNSPRWNGWHGSTSIACLNPRLHPARRGPGTLLQATRHSSRRAGGLT